MDERRTVARRERFAGLVEKSVNLGDGNHAIKVRKVLDFGMHSSIRSKNAIIIDDQDRILLIPEDTKCDKHKRLASRAALRENMNLHLTIEEGKILDVFIGNSP